MAIPRLFDFKAKTLARADQIDEEFQNLIAAIEGVAGAAAGADVYQRGVVASTDWAVTASAGSISAGTGALSYPGVGGSAWMPDAGGGLVRTFTAPANIGPLTLPSKPGPGGFMRVGVELTAAGSEAIPSVVCGAEQVSEALAIANPPAVSAGKIRVHDVVVKNVAGTYSAVAGRDRRPWARGGFAYQQRTAGGNIPLSGTKQIDTSRLQLRMECSGVPLELYLHCWVKSTSGSPIIQFGFNQDGAVIEEQGNATYSAVEPVETGGEVAADHRFIFKPTAGSHLFSPGVSATGEPAELVGSVLRPMIFSVRELPPSANNGTA